MNKRIQKQFTALQADQNFLFLYGEYKKASLSGDKMKINILGVSLSDYVARKHHKIMRLFKVYEYRRVWKYLGKRDFAENYHNNIGMRPEIN